MHARPMSSLSGAEARDTHPVGRPVLRMYVRIIARCRDKLEAVRAPQLLAVVTAHTEGRAPRSSSSSASCTRPIEAQRHKPRNGCA